MCIVAQLRVGCRIAGAAMCWRGDVETDSNQLYIPYVVPYIRVHRVYSARRRFPVSQIQQQRTQARTRAHSASSHPSLSVSMRLVSPVTLVAASLSGTLGIPAQLLICVGAVVSDFPSVCEDAEVMLAHPSDR